jgi:hypothetical protein
MIDGVIELQAGEKVLARKHEPMSWAPWRSGLDCSSTQRDFETWRPLTTKAELDNGIVTKRQLHRQSTKALSAFITG